MTPFVALRNVQSDVKWKAGDVLVVFGEVFSRGYVNGLIDEAKNNKMKVIFSTVGRRDEDNLLRPLTPSEIIEKNIDPSDVLINIPLESGFDLEKSSKGTSPVDQLQGVKLSEWEDVKLDWSQVEESRLRGIESFRERVKHYVSELSVHIPPGANVIFAHTMAGGVPRAKIIMPAMNRVFKGHGERYASSEHFWKSELGQLAQLSFMEVTANTLTHLIDLTKDLRARAEKSGGRVSYTAYGYHGTEILMQDKYQWQSYSPYLTGFAKIELEKISERMAKNGIASCVFNVPEILTNSSSIFLGVEVPLYSLLGAIRKEDPTHPLTLSLLEDCRELLKKEHSIDEIMELSNAYFRSDIIKKWSDFPAWPQHNGPEQMELMRETSTKILDMHKDLKNLLTATLSEIIYKACGFVMLREAWAPRHPVSWVGHDLIAKISVRLR